MRAAPRFPHAALPYFLHYRRELLFIFSKSSNTLSAPISDQSSPASPALCNSTISVSIAVFAA
jgi:hypothetical protein